MRVFLNVGSFKVILHGTATGTLLLPAHCNLLHYHSILGAGFRRRMPPQHRIRGEGWRNRNCRLCSYGVAVHDSQATENKS